MLYTLCTRRYVVYYTVLHTTLFPANLGGSACIFGNSAGDFGGSAVRRPFGHDSAVGLQKLVALLPNSMLIVQNWSEKGVYVYRCTINLVSIPYCFVPIVLLSPSKDVYCVGRRCAVFSM